ncbi:MAG: hypothetical protein M1817_003724 [Caeruleum heppii]|nr:MAG: hypothetical protein M1817_003724 [Caeruleum heppii]
MLSSLPIITPRDSHTLWYTSSLTHTAPPSNPSHSSTHPTHHHHHPSPPPFNPLNPSQNARPGGSGVASSHHHGLPRAGPDPTLTHLHAEESHIAARKTNIQRFGAGWLKPPGVAKTLQAAHEERVEREEVERLMGGPEGGTFVEEDGATGGVDGGDFIEGDVGEAEDEAWEAVDEAAEGIEGEAEADEEMVERDLDDDVPEAEGGGGLMDDDDDDTEEVEEDEEDEENDEDDEEEEVDDVPPPPIRHDRLSSGHGLRGGTGRPSHTTPINDSVDVHTPSSHIQSHRHRHVHHSGGFASTPVSAPDVPLDLDDDVPEASGGSWQHTDTESEEDGEGEGNVMGGAGTGGSNDQGVDGVEVEGETEGGMEGEGAWGAVVLLSD